MTDAASNIGVALLADEEIPTAFQILSKSFGHDAPFVNNYFPAHDTPAGQTEGSKRLAAWKHGSPASTFLKAVLSTGEDNKECIIGFAVWTHIKQAPPAELSKVENADVWPDEDDREYMTRLWSEYVIPRTRAVEESQGNGVYVLELLAVHPDHQRLGVGAALVKWGTRAADEKRLKSVVEGTPVARRLYEQCGMRAQIEEMRFNVGEGFSTREKPRLIFLVREPK
ncbi:hypothetical protein K458DRAFT_349335 [Lentithecium fluviatile CBS 122367]|uniref:N-acetyltransferase domain-containing protein n=1 Tax=Lentithecium fluviatile CBS 122367 TaxID=1168545 RepID=A0A6G1IIB4_9PLEO|nr:hypothetical protein K458DRAFT_349335 [Lentithecium fluviatile CBS 122367]